MLLAAIVVVCFLPYIGYKNYKKKQKKEDELLEKSRVQWAEEEKKRKEQETREHLVRTLRSAFGVELDTIHEQETQDEIIRIMNLLAYRAAAACVNQDKAIRGEEDLSREYQDVGEIKLRWAEARKFILQIAPELTKLMPHFSEFEPLKSYRADHIRQKKAKQSAAA